MNRLIVALLLMLIAVPAQAHKLKLFLTVEGAEVVGSAYFAGGAKAAALDGTVLDAQGKVVANLRTDADGGFRYAPSDGAAYLIRFESGDGHMAEAAIGAASATEVSAPAASAAPPADMAALEVAIARQLRPLREQIDALDARAKLSDVIGGIGFIFGLFGCYAWIAARRKKDIP